MRDRELQVGDAGFEVVHEAADRAVVLSAKIGNDVGCELSGNRSARRLVPCARALKSGQTSSGTLAARLRMRWARHRCRAARGKQVSIALMMPGAPSEVTRSGSFKPRLFMSSKSAVTVSVSSLVPAIICSRTRRPSIVKPQAARTGSRLAPGRNRSAMPSTNRYVISYSDNVRNLSHFQD